MKRTGLIGSLVVAALLLAGCIGGGRKADCPASGTNPPSCTPTTSETGEARPTFQSIEKALAAEGYSRTTSEGVYPASWVKDDTAVAVGKDLTGSVEVTFAEGKVRCAHLGGEPSGPNPLRLANDLKSKGFGLARTTFGCTAF